jgi:hypothetical protein
MNRGNHLTGANRAGFLLGGNLKQNAELVNRM